jgi:tetratricopeptide (TPR) repeat protein
MKNSISLKRFRIYILIIFIGIIFTTSYFNPCSAQKITNSASYKTLIKDADLAFAAKDYEGALKLYKEANRVEPDYNYPLNKIDQINEILNPTADSKAKQTKKDKPAEASYKTYIEEADQAFYIKDYAAALLFYNKAYQAKPDYNYAPSKIEEINTILNATPVSKVSLYENTILKADNLFKQKDYQQAKSEYQKALLIDSTAQLPKDRIQQISEIYTDPDDLANFNIAIANGDKELADSDFNNAIMFYEAALAMHPNTKFVKNKITDAKKQQADYAQRIEKSALNTATAVKLPQAEKPAEITNPKETPEPVKTVDSQLQPEQKKNALVLSGAENASAKETYDIALKDGDQAFIEKKYDLALSNYRHALILIPGEKYPSQKIEEITAITGKQKESDENYSKYIAGADKQFNENKFEDAIASYTKALEFKPDETYPQQKITEAQGKLSALKSKEENYASAIASGDRLFTELKYNEALNAYKQALTIKPNEAYPISKTAEINSILAKQKSDSENYAQAIRTGEKALAAGNLSLALTSFQDAQRIKPSEVYPVEQITEIKAKTANQQKKDEQYAAALKSGDELFASKDYNGALTSYIKAAELKKNEKYPQDQISKINKMLVDSKSADENYTLAVAEGDKLFAMKDYAGANTAFAKAASIKPAETYPKQRIIEINKIIDGIALTRSSEYNKALETADKLHNKKVFDQAIEAYETAAKINPSDSYPEVQISKIRKYMSDHAILDLYSQSLIISKGNEKKFTFSAIDPSLRKNNYILLKARSTEKSVPKVYLNYGKDETKNGGIVLRNLDKATLSDFLISISIQDKWFREENNWISISVETGEIEITKVQISAGE